MHYTGRAYWFWPPFRKFRQELVKRLSELHYKYGDTVGEEMLIVLSYPEAAILDEYRGGRHPAVVALTTCSIWLPAHFILIENPSEKNSALEEFAEMHSVGDYSLPSTNRLVIYFRYLSDRIANWIEAGEVPTQVYDAFRTTYLKALQGEQYNMITHIEANYPLTYMPKKN